MTVDLELGNDPTADTAGTNAESLFVVPAGAQIHLAARQFDVVSTLGRGDRDIVPTRLEAPEAETAGVIGQDRMPLFFCMCRTISETDP